MLLDNCTVVTMDAERRILRDAAIVVEGNSIAAVGKSERDARRASPTSPCATCTAGWSRPASSTATSTCRRRSCAAAATTCRCGSGWRSGSSSSRARSRAEDVRVSTRLAALEMLKAGTTAFLETLILGRHDARRRWPRRSRRPGCAPCSRAAVTDGGGYLDESPLSTGLYEAPEEAIADALEVAKQLPRLRADPHLVRAALDGRLLRGACCASSSTLARAEGLGLCQHYAMTVRERDWIREPGTASARPSSRSASACSATTSCSCTAAPWTPDDIAVLARHRDERRALPDRAREDGQRRDAGAPPAQRRHQHLARHRRGGRQQRRRPDPRPQVGRLPAEAAARRRDRRRPARTCCEMATLRRRARARAGRPSRARSSRASAPT